MKVIYNKLTKTFSRIKLFSDWDQIRDLVNDQLPKGIKKVEKVRGSETDKSYKVRAIYRSGDTKEVEVPITGKDALGNYNRATRSKVENTSKPKLDENKISRFKIDKVKRSTDPDEIRSAFKRGDASKWKNAYLLNKNTPPDLLEVMSDEFKDTSSKHIGEYSSDYITFCKMMLKHDKLTENTLNNVIDIMSQSHPHNQEEHSMKREVIEGIISNKNITSKNIDKLVDSGIASPEDLLSNKKLSKSSYDKLLEKSTSTDGNIQAFIDSNQCDNIYKVLSKGVSDKPKPFKGNYVFPYDNYNKKSLNRELPEVKLSEMVASCYADPNYEYKDTIRQIWKTPSDAIRNISKSMKPEEFTPEKLGKLAVELVKQSESGKSIDKTIKL